MALDISTAASVVGALGLGSVLGQWLVGGRDRRAVRAAALQALVDVETARWAPFASGHPNFSQAARALNAAALVARVPRTHLRLYLRVARVGYWESNASWEDNPDPEAGGGIGVPLAAFISDVAHLLADATWAPLLHRTVLFRRVKKLEARLSQLDLHFRQQFESASKYVV